MSHPLLHTANGALLLALLALAHAGCLPPVFPAWDPDGDGYGLGSVPPDCAPHDAEIYPGAPDLHGNGIDEDCDSCPKNSAGDGYDADCDGYATNGGPLDCDDGNPHVHPGAREICDGVMDNDCDGDADPLEVDDDGDGFTECGGASGQPDCDDTDAEVHPGAPEGCDGVDSDCDGALGADERDDDGDGVTECQGDCDDDDAGMGPEQPEQCDGIDNDCDGEVDEGTDIDDDGDGMTECQGDCDDRDDLVYEGAAETCDGLDNDCDGVLPIDETDPDGDEYLGCQDDCDDGETRVSPGAFEICDGVDNDCDGQIDGKDCVACTLHVPHDLGSIAAAIEAESGAPYEAVICVAPGRYQENLAVHTVDGQLTLLGVGGPTATTLEGDSTASVVRLDVSDEDTFVLRGFTITSGQAEKGGGVSVHWGAPVLQQLRIIGNHAVQGGGIYLLYSDAHLLDVTVEGNHASAEGGGIYSDNSQGTWSGLSVTGNDASLWGGGVYLNAADPVLERCDILSNTVEQWGGGGLASMNESRPEITSSRIEGNSAGYFGGGVYVEDTSAPSFFNVAVVANHAAGYPVTTGYGGGMYLDTDEAWLANVLIAGNESNDQGGGISMDSCGPPGPTLTNVIVVDNLARDSGGGVKITNSHASLTNVTIVANETEDWGGGLMVEASSVVSLRNLIVTGNHALLSGAGMILKLSSPTLGWSDIWSNTAYALETGGDQVRLQFDNYGEMHNVDYLSKPMLQLDPLYLDTASEDPQDWDLRLSASSPLIGQGDPDVLDPDGTISDLGAFGGTFGETGAHTWDLDGDGYYQWWGPGPLDLLVCPDCDCDDRDPDVYPGAGC